MTSEVITILERSLSEWDIELNPQQRMQFDRYAEILIDWNANRMNLTRLTSPAEIAIGHFLDSLAVTRVCRIPSSAKLIDIGTGAGFPGLAIKILRPDIKLTLLEGTAKKLTFCRAVADELAISDVNFVHARSEDVGESSAFRGIFDIVTARAVAPMEKLLASAWPFVSPQGIFVAWKGPGAADELRDAQYLTRRLKIRPRVVHVALPQSGEPKRVSRFILCQHEV